MTLGATLRDAATRLAAHSDSARLDAELLLQHVLGCTRAQLLLHGEDSLDAGARARFEALLARRIDGEPIAYLTGRQGFWSLDLAVDANVLVPRPETELLVEWALQCVDAQRAARIVDLGTGSGAIALALARERPRARVLASDISRAALAIARGNAERLGLAVEFREGAWWEVFEADERFDLAVSNPPYIAAGDPHLAALRHEPMLALSDDADGLQALRAIIFGAPVHLQPQAWLLVEHGHDQGAAVRALLGEAGFTAIETRRDLEQRERVSGGQWR